MNPDGRSVVILGTGSYAPARVLTNHDMSKIVDTTDEWIVTRTGIKERRIAAADEQTSDLAAKAGAAALADAGLTAADVDLVVVATCTPDTPLPAVAVHVQRKLGIGSAACFDLSAACSGFLYALDTADALIRSGRYRRALVIGAEKLSAVTDWSDRTTCVLFGDGAGAAVLGLSDTPRVGVLASRLQADGRAHELIHIACSNTASPDGAMASANSGATAVATETAPFIRMRGKEVFKLAVTAMEDAADELLRKNGVTPDQVKLLIPHQANLRIIDSIAQRMKLRPDQVYVNVERYGNTSAASIPIALDEARRTGRIVSGDYVLFAAFGAGLTWASALVRWH